MRHRLRMLGHLGRRVVCPCCGSRWRSFASFRHRPGALCLRCGALERHRALCLYLIEQLDPAGPVGGARPVDPARPLDVLHFAPERCIRELLGGLSGVHYVTADLNMPEVTVQADIAEMPVGDESFDLIICSHVLEHVFDDRRAMAELRRLLRGDGLLIVMVPRDPTRQVTYEDPAIEAPADRRRHFGQEDHVRAYGADLEQRLHDAGLRVQVERPARRLGPEATARHGLFPGEEIFVCSRRSSANPLSLGSGS